MRKIKEILRLKYVCGLSEREIAQSCRVTRITVGNYLRRAAAAKVTWQMAEGLNETELQARLFSGLALAECSDTPTSGLPIHLRRVT